MSSVDGDDISGRRRDSSLAHLAAHRQEMLERQITMVSKDGGLLVREAMDRRCVRSSLA